jgi:hypothetical protein
MASKNYFDQLGEGMKRLVGGGSKGYWNQLYNMVRSPSEKSIARGYGSLIRGVGSPITSIFGYLPDFSDMYDDDYMNKNKKG